MKPIIIAVSFADARAYAERRGIRSYRPATPSFSAGLRGYVGPVLATPQALDHPAFHRLLREVSPCGAAVPRDRVADRDRVA